MSRSIHSLLLLLLLLLPSLSLGNGLEERVQEHLFSNGLKLLVVERHSSPTFSAYITLGVGSVHETDSTRGVAHLLEHMLFKGTQTLGTIDYAAEKSVLQQIEEVGSRLDALRLKSNSDSETLATLEQRLKQLQKEHKKFVIKDEFSKIYAENGGVGYNAFTSKDQTSYLISLPANKLELWAAIESDRMKHPVLREFYTEREVVREERRRSYDSNPRGLLYENLLANAYTVHPYRNPIIGWDTDIRNLTLAETRDFLQRYYAPTNAVITLVGDLSFASAVEMIERYFGDIKAGTPVPNVIAVEPEQKGEKRIAVKFDAEPSLTIAYHKPTLPAREDYVFDIINSLLTAGPTSRLHRSLVVEQQLVSSISSYTAPGARYANLFVISTAPRYPHTALEVEQAIETELLKLANEPVAEKELNRIRKRLRTDTIRSLGSNSGLANMLSYYQSIAGSWRYLVEYERHIETVTAAEIMDVARTYFVNKNRTVVVLSREGMK
jgi:predicted Zn-dependent peptidase